MVSLAQLDSERLHRTERICHECSRVRTPLDDIYLLIVEFMYDIVDARSTHTDTRANWIQAFLTGDNGYFCTATGFACDTLDLNRAFINFRDFGFKQTAHKVTMS